GLHAVVEGPDVGVEAGPDVLDVEDDRVHARRGEDVGDRLTALEVGVVHRQAGGGIVVAALGAARLGGAPEAVLRAEDGGQPHPVVAVHDVDDVARVAGDAGGVGDDADALPVEQGVPVGREAFEAGGGPAAAARCRRRRGGGRLRRGGGDRHRGRGGGEQGPSGQPHGAASVIAAGVMNTHASC